MALKQIYRTNSSAQFYAPDKRIGYSLVVVVAFGKFVSWTSKVILEDGLFYVWSVIGIKIRVKIKFENVS